MCAKKCAKTLQGRKGHGIEEIYNNHPTKEGSIPWLQPSIQSNTVAHSLVKQDADLMKVLVKEAVQAFFEERWIHALERTVQTTDADLDTTQDITNIT